MYKMVNKNGFHMDPDIMLIMNKNSKEDMQHIQVISDLINQTIYIILFIITFLNYISKKNNI